MDHATTTATAANAVVATGITVWGEARGEWGMSRARFVDNRSDTPPPTRYP